MTLPGLPPPPRRQLPTPPGGAAAARTEGRRRRATALTAATAVAVVLLVATWVAGGRAHDILQVAVGGGNGASAAAPAQRGLVVDEAGQPVASIAVLRADLSRVLTRTRSDGTWSAPCGSDLLLAPYAPATRGGLVRERSPGAGNHAWRRVREHCGDSVRVVMPAGAVVTGRGTPGQDVRVQRLRGTSTEVPAVGPVFVTRVLPDGSWRIEGLDTGRYLLPSGRMVDVREGRTFRAP
jgi:hypothetical protein